MGYKDFLNETSTLNGDTVGEKITNELQSTFDRYFAETPNRVTVSVDGTDEDVVIQHIRYGEDKYDNQLLVTQNATLVDYGSKVTWDSRVWLVINAENRAIKTHKSWKILLTQNNMISEDEFGDVTSEPCHIQTKSSRSDGNSSVTLTENSWVIRVQKNDNTLGYYVNQRFLFNNKVAYQIVNINYSEFENQIEITLEPTQLKKEDDLANNIAHNEFPIDTTPQTGKNDIFFTKDKLDIIVGSTGDVEVYEYSNDVIVPTTTFTFRIDDIDSQNYDIVTTGSNSISIKSLSYYHTGTLVAIKDGDLTEYAIPLSLISAIG